LNKKLLIISPYFPPVNAADMQRVRMSLPYFAHFGWDAEVVTVAPEYSDMPKDALLQQSIPSAIAIHQVKALKQNMDIKIRTGQYSPALASFLQEKG
jgi:hypothetical protein